jgi:hypothetical protein
MRATSRSGQIFSRIVLPLILFVIVVAGVAWVIQYIPNIRNKPATDVPVAQNLVKFQFETGVWPEEKDGVKIKDYLEEFEPGHEGHFDFPFENTSGKEIETGLEKSSCTCTEVKIALIPSGGSSEGDTSKLSWNVMIRAVKPGEKAQLPEEKVLIPVGGRGIVRLGWKAKAGENSYGVNRLAAKLWFNPKGMPQSRQVQELQVAISIVLPVQFLPEKIEVPSFSGTHKDSFIGWSATRDLNAVVGADKVPAIAIDKKYVAPGFEFTITPLTKPQLAEFQKDLVEKRVPPILSRVKSAVKIDVSVLEKKNDPNVRLGEFKTFVPVLLAEDSRQVQYPHVPTVSGVRDSSIQLDYKDGTLKWTIRLGSFRSRDGAPSRKYTIMDRSDSMLTLVSSPANVNVKLHDGKEDGWKLEIQVPPDVDHFPPADNTISVHSQPRQFYFADVAAVLGTGTNFGQLDALPTLASLANFGFGAQLTGFTVLGEAVK